MNQLNFTDELPFAVTVCDTDGMIVYMNQKSKATFTGAGELIGKSLYDCHNENSAAKIREIMATGIPNSYTIEKRGLKKLIHQSPWYEQGKLSGLIEISIVIPDELPHFVRD
jgi:transcriptional regulator with PAS, ATPase and Fis domain